MWDEILDKDIVERDQFELLKEERILWKGKPKKYFSLTFLEMFGYYDSISFITGFQIFFLIITYYQVRDNYSDGNVIISIFSLVIGLIIILLPDLIKNHIKQKTKYYLTNKRVIIDTRNMIKRKVFELMLFEIGNITYQEFKNGTGVIHFMPIEKVNFKTRDFFASKVREYPSFELIENVVEEYKTIKEKISRLKQDQS